MNNNEVKSEIEVKGEQQPQPQPQPLSTLPVGASVTVTGTLRVRGAGDNRVNTASEVAGTWFFVEIFTDAGIASAMVLSKTAELLVDSGFGAQASSGRVTVTGTVAKQVPLDWSTGRAPRTWLAAIGRVPKGDTHEPSKFTSVEPPTDKPTAKPAFRWIRKPAAPAAVASVE